jgi:hypothetical protein
LGLWPLRWSADRVTGTRAVLDETSNRFSGAPCLPRRQSVFDSRHIWV